MKNKPNAYDYVISMFRSEEKLRPGMCVVFKQESTYIATDSHAVVYVDEKFSGLDYRENEKSPNALSILQNFEFDTELELDRDTLLSDYFTLQAEWSSDYQQCVECAGSGESECTCCDNISECKYCDGSGDSDDRLPFAIPSLSGDKIKLYDRKISTNLLHRVIQSAFFLQQSKIIVKFKKGEERQPNFFEVGEAKIIVMPIL